MPQDYNLTIDGKSYDLNWTKPTPPTKAEIEGIVKQYRTQAKQPASSATPAPKTPAAEPDRKAIDKFRLDFFNTDNANANVPKQTADALAKNPQDASALARLSKMSAVAQSAIREHAQEIKAENDRTQQYIHSFDNGLSPQRALEGIRGAGSFANPVAQQAYAAQNVPGFQASAAFKGPEGAKQGKVVAGGKAAPILNVLSDFAAFGATPEGLGAGEGFRILGGLGKAGHAAAALTGTGFAEKDAYQRYNSGDKVGAATSALIGLVPLLAPALSKAVEAQKAKSVTPPKAEAVSAPNAGEYTSPRVKSKPEPAGKATDVPQVKPNTPAPPVEPPVETKPEVKPTGAPKSTEKPKSSKPAYPREPAVKPRGYVKTKVANDYTEQARKSMGLDKLPDAVRITHQGVADHVIKTGMHYDASNVAQRVLDGGHAMSTEEVMANNLRQHMIEHRLRDLNREIEDGSKKGEDVDAKKIQVEKLHDEFKLLTDATKRTGTLTSQALNIRKETVDEYSHPKIRQRLEEANPGVPVEPEVKEAATKLVKERDALTQKVSAREKAAAERSEKASKDAGAEAVAKMRQRTAVRADKKAELAEELKRHIDRLLKATSQLNAGIDPSVIPIIRDIAVNRLKVAGLSAEALVDQVHGIISEHLPGVSKREVRDAISGYGQDPQAAKRSTLADLKEEMRLVSEIEDTKAGIARQKKIAAARKPVPAVAAARKTLAELKGRPQATARRMQEMRLKGLQKRLAEVTKKAAAGDTSVQPRTPGNASPQELSLRKQIAEKQKVINDLRAKEKAAAKPAPTPKPAKVAPTHEEMLSKQKEQLARQIEKVQKRIDDKDFSKGPGRPTDTETEQLKERLSALKGLHKSMDPNVKPEPTRLEILEKQFEEMKAKNATGDYGKTAATPRPDTPEEAEMRSKLNAARRERGTMRKAESPTPPKDPFAAYKKQQQKRLNDLQRQIDAGVEDMQSKRSPVVRDEQAEADKLEIKRKEKELDRLVKSQQPKSYQDRFIAWRRFAALSHLGSISKLGAAASTRVVFGPLEETAGLPARYLTPNIERNAPTQGRPSLRAEKAAINKFLTKQTWTGEAVDKFRTGHNSLDLKYGKSDFEGDTDKPTLLNLPGRMHGAIKTPAQMAAFERAEIKGYEWAERQGLDTNDPLVQGHIGARAYQESLRAILMQDNVATDLYKTVITGLEHNAHPAGKATATLMRAFLPIVKVPTNFAGEVGTHLLGGVRAAWEVKVAGGVKNLTPEQCDIVLRSLKKQGVGGMMFAIGYFNPNKFGGTYVPRDKPKAGAPAYGNIRIGSMELPHNILHNPAIEAMQIGATWRRVQDEEIKKRASGHPFLRPLEAAGEGVAENVPFLDFPKRLGQASEGGSSLDKFAGEEAGGMLIPGFASEAGALFNKDAQGKQIQRKPQGFWDEIKMAAGFQTTVPTSSPSSRGGSLSSATRTPSATPRMSGRSSFTLPK